MHCVRLQPTKLIYQGTTLNMEQKTITMLTEMLCGDRILRLPQTPYKMTRKIKFSFAMGIVGTRTLAKYLLGCFPRTSVVHTKNRKLSNEGYHCL